MTYGLLEDLSPLLAFDPDPSSDQTPWRRQNKVHLPLKGKRVAVKGPELRINATQLVNAAADRLTEWKNLKNRDRGLCFEVFRGLDGGCYVDLETAKNLCDRYQLKDFKKSLEKLAASPKQFRLQDLPLESEPQHGASQGDRISSPEGFILRDSFFQESSLSWLNAALPWESAG